MNLKDLKHKKTETIKEIPSGDFFKNLTEIGFQQMNLTITKKDNNDFVVIVKPNNFSKDPAYDDLKPLTISGTAEELDKGFLSAIQTPLKKLHGLMSNAEDFIVSAEEKELKTKQLKEKLDKYKKIFEKAEKEYKHEDFNVVTSGNNLIKKFTSVVDNIPKSKEGKTAAEYIQEIKKNQPQKSLL